jgi:hypothetical protein
METTEKIIESYVRYVRRWATIPNVKCDGQYEIDLLALDPRTHEKYHIESGVSASTRFSRLTAKTFDRGAKVSLAVVRRTLRYFVENKFGPREITSRLNEYGFTDYTKIIVTWGWMDDAKREADSIGIELWHFRDVLKGIADEVRDKTSYFGDDTLRTIGLFIKASYDEKDQSYPVSRKSE